MFEIFKPRTGVYMRVQDNACQILIEMSNGVTGFRYLTPIAMLFVRGLFPIIIVSSAVSRCL